MPVGAARDHAPLPAPACSSETQCRPGGSFLVRGGHDVTGLSRERGTSLLFRSLMHHSVVESSMCPGRG